MINFQVGEKVIYCKEICTIDYITDMGTLILISNTGITHYVEYTEEILPYTEENLLKIL